MRRSPRPRCGGGRRADRARAGLLAALIVPALLVAPAAASAEAELLGTRPMAGATLLADEVPPTARAVFDGPVTPGEPAVEVRDASGDRVDLGGTGAGPSPAVVEVALPDDLPAGRYEATWRVVTSEGVERDGAWTFEVVATSGGWFGGRSGPGQLLVAAIAGVAASVGLVAWRRRTR